MGLIRKIASASTLGGVKYTSRREAETKERLANAKLMRQQLKQDKQDSSTAGSQQQKNDKLREKLAIRKAERPSFGQITAAGKLQRQARRRGEKMTIDEAIMVIREADSEVPQ
jgi:hypothetical protein